jgi:hypothetical protein
LFFVVFELLWDHFSGEPTSGYLTVLALRLTLQIALLDGLARRPSKRRRIPLTSNSGAIDFAIGKAVRWAQREGRIQSAERAVPTLRTISKVTNLLSA